MTETSAQSIGGYRALLVAGVSVLLLIAAWLRGELSGDLVLLAMALLVCGWYALSRALGRDAQLLIQNVSRDEDPMIKLIVDICASLFGLTILYFMFASS